MTKKIKIDGKRSQIKREREIRIKAKQKHNQKKRDNEELFQMIKSENLDKLDLESRKKTLVSLHKLISSFPHDNADKYPLMLVFLSDKNSKVIIKAMRLIKKLCDDLIPSYKVRTDEANQKHSKEVEFIKRFENAIFNLYTEFIKNLNIFIKAFKNNEKAKTIREFSYLCIGALFEKFYYFNSPELLYKTLIEGLYDHNSTVRSICFDSLNKVLSVFDNSANMLEMKLNLIKLISHYIYIKDHKLFDQNVLDLLIAHRIEFPDISKKAEGERMDLDNIKVGKKIKFEQPNKFMTKQQNRIEKKEEKKLNAEKNKIVRQMQKEMNEYDNTPKPKAVYYSNLKILKKILLVYFEIIKHKRDSPLIRSVLKGIGILCENINVEILLDLQKCLYEYIQYSLLESDNINQKIFSISALKTCLSIAEKLTKDIISIDDTNLINSTFLFLHVVGNKHIDHLTKDDLFILLEIIEMLLIKNRQFSLDIVAAYIKKIAIFISKLDEAAIPSFLLILKRVTEKYPNLQTMVDINDEDNFNYKSTDPSLSNGRLTNICGEINTIKERYKTSKADKGKLIRQLCDYVKSEKINPIFNSMNYFDSLF
jgi:hypothetical protein